MPTSRFCSTAALLLVVAATPLAVRAQGAAMQTDSGRSLVTAHGTARQAVSPDRASLTLLIDTQGQSIDEAGSRLAATERAVLDTLRRFNLSAGAIQTYTSGVGPFRGQGMGPSMLNGPSYVGRSTVRVDLPRVDLIGPVTAAALAKGATFGTPTFIAGAADSVRRVLMPRAFEAARRDAEVLARAAGGRLGRLVDVASAQPVQLNEQNQMVYLTALTYENGPRVTPNTTVTVNVTTRWLFIPDAR
jgi:uncharacterized protein YggE